MFSLSLQRANTPWQGEQTTSCLELKQVNVDVKYTSLEFGLHGSTFLPFQKKQKRDIFNLIYANNCHIFVDGVIWITRQSILSSKKQGQVF